MKYSRTAGAFGALVFSLGLACSVFSEVRTNHDEPVVVDSSPSVGVRARNVTFDFGRRNSTACAAMGPKHRCTREKIAPFAYLAIQVGNSPIPRRLVPLVGRTDFRINLWDGNRTVPVDVARGNNRKLDVDLPSGPNCSAASCTVANMEVVGVEIPNSDGGFTTYCAAASGCGPAGATVRLTIRPIDNVFDPD